MQRDHLLKAVNMVRPLAFCLLLAGSLSLGSKGGDWPRFRGPNGSGVAQEGQLPVEFGPGKNVLWKVSLPAGHSSPILSRDRIFLTAVEEDKLWTLCLEQQTGKLLWRREAPRPRREKLDGRNNPAAPSAAADESSVYVFFSEFGLLSYDLEGNERWRHPVGPFNNTYGMGASPVLADDKVILLCDQQTNSFLLALGKDDGQVRWKVERPEATSGHSTPVLYSPPDGPTQVLVAGSFFLTAYRVDNGQKAWWVGGLSSEIKSTPVMGGGMVFVNGYFTPMNQPDSLVSVPAFETVQPEHDADQDGRISRAESPDKLTKAAFPYLDLDGDGALDEKEWNHYRATMAAKNGVLGFRLGGQGDMTASNLVWQYHKSVPQLPSPLIYQDVLYMVNDGGIVTSFKPASGEVIAQGRLEGAVDKYYASPVAADGKVYMVSETGKAAVLKSDGSLGVLAVNDMESNCYATPAIADGRIYLRTVDALYCFALP